MWGQNKPKLTRQYIVSVKEPPAAVPTLSSKKITHKMENLSITPSTIEKQLSELNVNESCGPDGFHPKLLRRLSSEIHVLLWYIMNSSLNLKQLAKE